MSPAELDIVLNGAFICERPDGTRYAQWSRPPGWTNTPFTRSGPLTAADLERPSVDVLADITNQLPTTPSITGCGV